MLKLFEIYDLLYTEEDYDNPEVTNNRDKWEVVCRLLLGWDFDTLVDLGCGRGYYLRRFIELGKKAFGVEFSKVCCDRYLKDVPHVNYSIQEYCANGNDCDLIFCMDVLEHIEPEHLINVLTGVARLSDRALFGVANHTDEIHGFNLHLLVEGSNWWKDVLSKFYRRVDVTVFSDRFYFFKCDNRVLGDV